MVGCNIMHLCALRDDESKFWIAQQVGNAKFTDNIKPG
jgi:hypothetical protein